MADQQNNPGQGQGQGQGQQTPNQGQNPNPQNPGGSSGQRESNIPGERPSEAHDETWRKKDEQGQGQQRQGGNPIEQEQRDRQNPSSGNEMDNNA
jgi:Ca-activated chloride channel family protein